MRRRRKGFLEITHLRDASASLGEYAVSVEYEGGAHEFAEKLEVSY
jgi:hypothetical protein